MKKVYIETYGCQMNEHDSERMLSILSTREYEATDRPVDADVIIVNTCSVRTKAEQKAYSSIGRYIQLKKKQTKNYKDKLVVFSGCVAQQEGGRLFERFKGLNIVVGPAQVHRIDELLEMAEKQETVIAVDPNTEQNRFKNPVKDINGVKAYVTIMEGCDNFCSYCTVPYLRGREVSRNARAIIDEAYMLVSQGVRELILLGQNVNSYRDITDGRDITLYELLSMLNDIKELKRIRFVTSHPKDLTEKLMHAFTDFDKVCPHIHLPIQSGSDRILKLMARGYTVEEYMAKVEKLRTLKPDIAITSDFIVGFPSETTQDHQDTVTFVKRLKYDNIFSFKYSDRPLARSSRYGNKLPMNIISDRLRELQSVQLEITRKIYSELKGTVQEVLVEGESKKKGRLQGRTAHGRIVNFEGSAAIGTITGVFIDDCSDNALYGRCIVEEV
ncbi:MAG: tRNA (N6-isopentenyl adenosine(37)-C2)-methylthiotransferase MiaB [bacterium]